MAKIELTKGASEYEPAELRDILKAAEAEKDIQTEKFTKKHEEYYRLEEAGDITFQVALAERNVIRDEINRLYKLIEMVKADMLRRFQESIG